MLGEVLLARCWRAPEVVGAMCGAASSRKRPQLGVEYCGPGVAHILPLRATASDDECPTVELLK